MASRFSQSSTALAVVTNYFEELNITSNTDIVHEDGERSVRDAETASSSYGAAAMATTSMAYLPQTVVLCELRHEAFEGSLPSGPSDSGLVSKWRPRDRVTSCFLPPNLMMNILFFQLFVFFLSMVNIFMFCLLLLSLAVGMLNRISNQDVYR